MSILLYISYSSVKYIQTILENIIDEAQVSKIHLTCHPKSTNLNSTTSGFIKALAPQREQKNCEPFLMWFFWEVVELFLPNYLIQNENHKLHEVD